jgi:ABC-type transport system involved in multi-copper enzyme maturation permease subunit
MKVVLTFGTMIVLLVGALPVAIYREGGQVSSMVQTFLSWSLMPIGMLLSFLAIFLSALSISDEMANHHVFMLFSKPVAKWRYVLGKWVGVVYVLTMLLAFTGVLVYVMAYFLSGWHSDGVRTGSAGFFVGFLCAQIAAISARMWRQRDSAAMGLQVVVVIAGLSLFGFFLWVVFGGNGVGLSPEDAIAQAAGRLVEHIAVLQIGMWAVMLLQIAHLARVWTWAERFGWFQRVFAVVALAGMVLGIYVSAMSVFLREHRVIDSVDLLVLDNEVLTARATARLQMPDITRQVEVLYKRGLEDGRYRDMTAPREAEVKGELHKGLSAMFYRVATGQTRVFEFSGINVNLIDRSGYMYLKYKARGEGYASDEALISQWYFGASPQLAWTTEPMLRKDVMDRYQTVVFRASSIGEDGRLFAIVHNREDLRQQHPGAGFKFESLEVLYEIGTFGGNLARTLFLVWCRIALIASVGVFAATIVSYPVACLIAFFYYSFAVVSEYVIKALGFGAPGEGALGKAQFVIEPMLNAIFFMMPKFSKYDGVEQFVDGINVSLMWDIQGFVWLTCMLSGPFLLVACLAFRRRQVAELSI